MLRDITVGHHRSAMMSTRTPPLLATVALLGCPQVNNDCGAYNPFFCVKDEEGSGFGAATENDTAEPPTLTVTNTASTTVDTSDPPTSTTNEPTTIPPPDSVCDMDSVCDPGEDMLDDCPDCETCGNSMIDGEEQCDDGNDSNQDACVSCNDARCGDGYRQIGVETCDDGDGNTDDYNGIAHCNATCTDVVAYCGDDVCQINFENFSSCPEDGCKVLCGNNIVEEGETCDEGVATQTCDSDCTEVMCGDGQLNESAGELCDDGNEDSTDACLPSCIPAKCGDDIVQFGFEECDDGNQVETDLCDTTCKLIIHRTVFVSSLKYNGNLGGLSGADAKCAALAASSGLSGHYKAWLSSLTVSPAIIFDTEFTGVYELSDGTVVARGWSGLVSGTLESPINLDEFGDTKISGVWTNTTPDGNPSSQNDCLDWTSTGFTSTIGLSNKTNYNWTTAATNTTCNALNSLYCFEDPV